MDDLHDLVPTDNYRLSPLPDNCSLEDVLDLLAGAQTAQILRLLRAGPRRFGDLPCDLIKVSTKLLTNRLSHWSPKPPPGWSVPFALSVQSQ